MDSKTFLQEFINENPKIVLRTQFVLVSSNIRKSGRYEKQVINANNMFFPNTELIMDYDDYKNNHKFREKYYDQIRESNPFLATIITYAIKEKETIVFLCTKREMKKYNYLEILVDYIKEEFDYPVIDYKKLKKGTVKKVKYSDSYTLNKCKKVLKKAKKEKRDKMLSSEKGREKYFKDMSKKELIKELKKRDLYIEDMDKSEMIEMLDMFV